jgi:UDP-N-acetylglucosamine diphosphorylase / glucose-1-phosphate thymidylyltransferase / UDP-N-acetylgalactosamine diphosphorylase / glucosamine-1-phosphate N-acetyltransferase / galactosamine-1-phosphate N-acetyltransferase
MFKPSDLFDLGQTEHVAIFEDCEFAWDVLKKIKAYVAANARPELRNKCEGRAWIGEQVLVGEGTVIEDGVMIKGPAIIGQNCQIRHNAYIREDVIIGDNCVVGNSSEVKNSIFFNYAQAPHFNYIGDSVLGYKAHIGAGVKISNLKLFNDKVVIEFEGQKIDTGLRKFGAMMGDRSEVGCNAVLSPGTVIGRDSLVYANVTWRGVLPPNMIAKNRAAQEIVVRRPSVR